MAPEVCPLCGRARCWRQIQPYFRWVIELFPYCEGRIPVARFQCREKVLTFSLLPYQLAPYRLYTVESMIFAVLVWCELHREDEGDATKALRSLHNDCRVTPWLLRNWLGVVVVGFRSGHPFLGQWYDLSGIHSGNSPGEMLDEVYGYYSSFGSRGPPSRKDLRAVLRRYSCHTDRHLLGKPFQERGGLSVR